MTWALVVCQPGGSLGRLLLSQLCAIGGSLSVLCRVYAHFRGNKVELGGRSVYFMRVRASVV
jgi:hypothetical protein